MPVPTWEAKSLPLMKEAAQQGDAKIAAQLQIALAADSRASVLAGIFVAAALVVVGGLASSDALRRVLWVDAGAAGAFLAFFGGAVLCIWAARPVNFKAPGYRPSAFYKDIETGVNEWESLGSRLVNLDEDYDLNDATIERNARFFKWGSRLGVLAPLIAVAFAAASLLLYPAADAFRPGCVAPTAAAVATGEKKHEN